MIPTLSFRFPLGRYHATPWDHSANEGRLEWPPSPWRLLRALLAVWHQRAPEIGTTTITGLLQTLAGTAPRYVLPNTTHGHTRHYMPGVDLDHQGREKRFLAFDNFLSLPKEPQADGPGALLVTWDTELTDDQAKALAVLAQRMPYLGRADSICVAELLDTTPERDTWITPDPGGELRLLAPAPDVTPEQVEIDTRTMRKDRMVTPPGACWIGYTTPGEQTRKPDRPVRHRPRPTAVRFALESPAPLHFADTLLITDTLRRACLSLYGKQHRNPDGTGGQCPPLSGKDHADNISRNQHQHAHYLAYNSDTESPYLDTAVIWLPAGFDPDVLRAVTALRRLRPRHSRSEERNQAADIRVALEHVGDIADATPETTTAAPVTTWRTLTPVCFRRHRKKETTEEFVTHELRAELAAELDLPTDDVITKIHPTPHGTNAPWPADLSDPWARRYRRHRPSQTMNQRLPGLGLTLELAPTTARKITEKPRPLILGAHRHFGLGLLTPVRSAR
ncbi:type I-G CRISPR-associated protein Csb2 [Saccharopolyspora hattusasensis]|uniref:type I-G CRISPR-associated protein Csb2 n=1 Tax=Saccharopolyspora hattusasensis TaxID=1128679 RepID=UPI003D97706F